MKKELKDFGGNLLRIGIFFGVIFLAIFFVKGAVWLSAVLYQWIAIVSIVVFVFSVLVLIPLSLFKKTKGFAGVSLLIASFIIGANLWIWSLLLVYSSGWGMMGVIIGLLLGGVGIIPIAMLAALFNGAWAILGELILLIIIFFVFRMLAKRTIHTK